MDKKMLAPLRKVMEEFILADSREITLIRPALEKTSTGGWRRAAWEPRPPQQMRLVPYKRRLSDLVKVMASGEIPNIPYVLVGKWDADVERFDEFVLDDAYYRVEALEPHTAVQAYTDRKVAQLTALDKAGVQWIEDPP